MQGVRAPLTTDDGEVAAMHESFDEAAVYEAW
jgi:hypothetical protein